MRTAVLDDGASITSDVAYQHPRRAAPPGPPPETKSFTGQPPVDPSESSQPPSKKSSTTRLYLSSLPPQMAKALSVYDTDFDGILGDKEVACAALDMEHMQSLAEQEKEGKIPLDFFPEPVQKILKEFDSNSDGDLDVVEIMHGFEALKRERKRKQQLFRVIFGLLMFTVILLGAVGGLMAWVVDANRQTSISSDARLTVKDGSEVVQTAGADFQVRNGVMVERDHGCVDETCPSKPLKMSQSLTGGRLTSEISDEDLEELRTMKIGNGASSWIFFQVMAVARYPAQSKYGTIVVIYTHLGEITLDGDDLSFHESIKGAFSQAGFPVDRSGRRLLGVVEVLGMFNLLRSAVDRSVPGNFSHAVNFVNGVSTYKATVKIFTVCFDDSDHRGRDGCFFPSGQAVDHAVSLPSGNFALQKSESQQLYSIKAQPYSKSVTKTEQYPFQELHTIQNASHKLTFQKFKDVNYHCQLEKDSGLGVALATTTEGNSGADEGTAESTAADFEVTDLGFVEVDGADGLPVRCRHWRISAGGAADLFYFQHIQEDRLYQLNYSNLIYRFDEIDFTVESVSDNSETVPAVIDIEAILEACDPTGITKPFKWMGSNEISDKRFPEPDWGVAASEAKSSNGEKIEFEQMTSTEFEAYFRSLFFNGTVVDYEQYLETRGESAQESTWCLDRRTNSSHESGLSYVSTNWVHCDENARRTVTIPPPYTVQISIGLGVTDPCFTGTGSTTIVRNAEASASEDRGYIFSWITSGSLQFRMNVLTCFKNQYPSTELAAGATNKGASGAVSSSADSVVSAAGWVSAFTEKSASCNGYTSNRMGNLVDSLYFRGDSWFPMGYQQFNGNQGTGPKVFTVDIPEVKVKTLVLVPAGCGSMQRDSNDMTAQLGFRFGFSVKGTIVWSICWNGASGSYVYCNQLNSDGTRTYPSLYGTGQTFSFDVSRQVFPPPAPAVDNCRRDSSTSAIYRYLCTDGVNAHSVPTNGNTALDCTNPIGMIPIAGERCQCVYHNFAPLDPPGGCNTR